MSLDFPSREFDDVVAGACHGTATEAELEALNGLLRTHPAALDEYLLRVEVHARLASDPDLSRAAAAPLDTVDPERRQRTAPGFPAGSPLPHPSYRPKRTGPIWALAACLLLAAMGVWSYWFRRPPTRAGPTSTAIAMLTRAVDARWAPAATTVRVGSALAPGWLRLESGMVQVVSYTGARMVVEGPAELRLLSPSEAYLANGKLVVEVPQPARGFRVRTPHACVVDRDAAFGVEANDRRTEVHVFRGQVDLVDSGPTTLSLTADQAAAVEGTAALQRMTAHAARFISMRDFQRRSLASEALRFDQWRLTNARLKLDPSLVVHFDFEDLRDGDWTLRNAVEGPQATLEGTIVGCQRVPGRWREKQALEFQNVNDRLRFGVPGEFGELTLAVWVCLQGLDRQFSSLLMCDGFAPGTLHWLIREDGVLGLTVFGEGQGNFQILASPAVIHRDDFGLWLHLAVVLDGDAREVTHYLNGTPVSRHRLRLGPPYRLGPAELGNWNEPTGPNPEPALIRNLSGAIDEFELFSRALSDAEIRDLFQRGSTEP